MPTEPRQQWPHRREPGGQALAERDAGDRVVAILAAASLFLASIELAIPKPVPFLRLGLANLPILIALRVLRPRQLLLLLGLKILGQGMVQGTLFSYIILFSAASSVASVAAMWLVDRASRGLMSLVGVAVVGALASNLAQLGVARWLVFGESAWLIAAPFVAVGTASAVLLGLFGERFVPRSQWVRTVTR